MVIAAGASSYECNMLHFWLYVSAANVPPRSVDDALIYLQARNRNAARGISGYLHREDGYYVQYVEGPPAELDQLKNLIRRDWRHENIRVLADGSIMARKFFAWDMAFTDAETSSFRAIQALSGGETDIGRASAEEILTFMERTALSGRARSVSQLAGHSGVSSLIFAPDGHSGV